MACPDPFLEGAMSNSSPHRPTSLRRGPRPAPTRQEADLAASVAGPRLIAAAGSDLIAWMHDQQTEAHP